MDPPPSERSLVHLAMSSEKKEFDEKLLKKLVDEGRTEGEVAEIAEVSPATALRRRAISVKGAIIGATPPRGLGPRAAGRLAPFAGPRAKTKKRREREKEGRNLVSRQSAQARRKRRRRDRNHTGRSLPPRGSPQGSKPLSRRLGRSG